MGPLPADLTKTDDENGAQLDIVASISCVTGPRGFVLWVLKEHSMKLASLLGAAALATVSASAMAADLPTSKGAPVAPAVYAPAFTWTGFYLGVNAGVGWANGRDIYVTTPNGAVTSLNTGNGSNSGFVGGGQAGYNFQTGAFVFGVEADIQYADLSKKVNWGPYTWWGNGSTSQYVGTVRARVGYAIDRTLIFLTGGLAYGGLNSGGAFGGNNNTGWTLGGGVEDAFTNNWTAKIEYDYIQLDTGSKSGSYYSNVAIGAQPAGYYTATSKGNGSANLVRVGVNYKF
jgi:outer membrane immunogenic protein